MNRPPTISAIIPAYNAADCLRRAIDSVLAQTFPVVEILVVDDGSRDRTAQVASSYPPPVHLLRQDNGGPAAARNRAARAAQGEWLALLDADDSWLPHKLERQMPFTADSAVGVIHSPATDARDTTGIPEKAAFDTLWRRNCVVASSALIRRTAFEQVRGFDEDRALIAVEDYNLWLRLAAAGWAIVPCPERLIHYTRLPGSLSSQIERFALAEFANVDKIARSVGLLPQQVRQKRVAIGEEYGRKMFSCRQYKTARSLLAGPLRAAPSPIRLAWWLATFLPPRRDRTATGYKST